MSTQQYLVEMSFQPFATIPSPAELRAFTERFVLPTLEACERLVAAGRIVAGGTTLAAVGFTFVAQAESGDELEQTIASLPLWGRSQTRVVPLGTFASRAASIRARLAAQPGPAPAVAGAN